MLVPLCILLRVTRIAIRRLFSNYFIGKLQKKAKGEELEQKVEKSCKGIFKIAFFGSTWYIGMFHVLNQTPFAPSLMFGDGEVLNTFGNYPFTPMPAMTKIYYMLSLSYYIEDGVQHLFQTPKYDYWEMVLHHVITGMLIFSSYMNGFWTIGIFVLIQMDLEDIFVGLIRT